MDNKEMYLEPARYAEGLYHIGTRYSPCWLIDCGEEIALLDTAMPDDFDFLLENIKGLGYDFRKIKHILHSHGHIDHIGCTKAFAELTGAKTYIGKGDEDTVAGRNQLQWTNEFKMEFNVSFEADVIICGEDRIKIGNKEFYFVATPGHTAGVMSIFFNVTDNGQTYRAGMFGGGGFNSLSLEYLDKYSLPHTLRDDYIRGIDRLYRERVDVHLGNHLGNNGHMEKIKALGKGKNPFIEGESFKALLDERRASAIEFFKNN